MIYYHDRVQENATDYPTDGFGEVSSVRAALGVKGNQMRSQ